LQGSRRLLGGLAALALLLSTIGIYALVSRSVSQRTREIGVRIMRSPLYSTSATDALSFVATSFTLIAVALLACYMPARRAMKVDSMVALRYE